MKYNKEMLEDIVKESKSITEVLRKLNLKESGGNHTHISKLIKFFDINTQHFLGKSWNREKIFKIRYDKQQFISNVLIINGPKWQSHKIKLKLFEFNIKEKKCEICKQNDIWENKILSLQLHHINGDRNDNRLINLQILCPNCHSQTETFSFQKNVIRKKKRKT